jgi:exodeoxyribonuclease V alpha subunit
MADHLPLHRKTSPPLVELQGILERVTFLNRENGYTVARLQMKRHGAAGDGKELITVVGHLAEAPVGSTLSLTGGWRQDVRYGRQFQVHSYSILKPNTLNGIERYLGSGLIKGIGAGYAARIVARFGIDTLDILDTDPDRLREVAGLGRKRIELIKKAWSEQKEIHAIMIFLQAHAVSASYAVKIFKTYGTDALKIVQENPYQLAEDIYGIGFHIADAIAGSLGVPANDTNRLQAGLLFALKEAAKDGHCYLERAKLEQAAAGLLELPAAPDVGLREHIAPLVLGKKIVDDDSRIYLAPLYYAETGVASQLKALLRGVGGFSSLLDEGRQQVLDWIGQRMGVELAPEQREALLTALVGKVSVLTGGPGTGKSTLLRGLILLLEKNGITFSLAAPTGRAAKRLGETCGREAATIHRLLEFDPSLRSFKRNGANPLRAEMVIIDETSMLDIQLAHSLFKAVAADSSLLLVGDVDQLPSVGPGNVLRDIIASGAVPVVQLQQIFRQGAGSLISVNAARVNRGESLDLSPDYRGDKDFYCIFREDQKEIEEEIVSLCSGRLTRKFGFDPILDIQVLAPMRRGLIGCDHLNRRLQEIINPGHRAPDEKQTHLFRIGDKVMQMRNNYDKEVFNGDLGVIAGLAEESQGLTVLFEGRPVPYEAGELDELELAYAITVHKSQGSEFPCIIMPIHPSHYLMLQRNLLYTSITRGKKLVIVIGSRKAITMAINNNRQQRRNSHLRERLQS